MADITSNLICRYPFEANEGGFFKNSVEDAHHLFIVGATTATGIVGTNCANFTATSQYATTGTWSAIQGTGAFTCAFWFKTSTGGNQNILSFGADAGGQSYRVRLESGVVWLRTKNATITGGSGLSDGNWHHVVITQPASATMADAKLYIDGSEVTPTVTGPTQALDRGTVVDLYLSYDFSDGAWFVGQKDDLRFYQRELAAEDVTALYELTDFTEFSSYTIISRAVGSTSISGSFTGTTPSSMEVQLVDYDDTGTVIQDWTALTSLSVGTNTWSGTLAMDESLWLKMRVRKKDGGGTVLYTTDYSSNRFGMGAIFLCAGQSNMAHVNDWYTTLGTLNTNTALYQGGSWKAVWADGGKVLSDLLQQEFGCLVGLVDAAQGGTGLYQDVGSGYWLDLTPGSPYMDALDILAVVGDVEMILWHQGEADAWGGTSTANYKTSLDTLYSRFLAVLSKTTAQLPFGIGSLSTLNDGSTAAHVQAIRVAQQEWAEETTGAFYLGTQVDITRTDDYHLTEYQHIAHRWAQSILYHYGLASFSGEGPYITSARRQSGSAVIRVLTTGAATLQEVDGNPAGLGITGFEVSDDDFSTTLTISATSFEVETTHVLLTLSAAPADEDVIKVRYQYGAVPTITKPVYCNLLPQSDTRTLPLQFTNSPVTASLGAGAIHYSTFWRPKL